MFLFKPNILDTHTHKCSQRTLSPASPTRWRLCSFSCNTRSCEEVLKTLALMMQIQAVTKRGLFGDLRYFGGLIGLTIGNYNELLYSIRIPINQPVKWNVAKVWNTILNVKREGNTSRTCWNGRTVQPFPEV